MKFRRGKSNMSRAGKLGRVVATLVAATAGGGGLLLANTGTASASPAYFNLVPASDWLNVAVAGASYAPGAPIIQWTATGGTEQKWSLPKTYTTGEIVNENSQMCITTDGVAGDQLFQEPCNGSAGEEWFNSYQWAGPNLFENPASGLVMDVYGYAMYAGGHIDAWYENQAPNQYFWSE